MSGRGPIRRGGARASRGPHSRAGRLLYAVLWVLSRTLAVAVFGLRYRFVEPLPAAGGLLMLSSHQSHLDPLILGLVCDRRLSSLARSSLFRFPPFAAAITALDAIPIDRDASIVAAMKAVIRRLEAGAAVTVYPEGSRTADGRLGECKPGFALIAKRAGVPIVPVAIVGAFECWPRTRRFPRPGRIRVEFGPLITAAEVAALDEQALFAEGVRRIRECDARARAARSGRDQPSAGAAASDGRERLR